MFDAVVITCEHGGARIPRRHAALFAGRERLLASHRGYDPGSLDIAEALARRGGWPLAAATTSRLLIELNRSLGHPALFSTVTKTLDARAKQALIRDVYEPYRRDVQARLERGMKRGRTVLHLSSHTFTPVRRGETRRADVGLLYDPRRPLERRFCRRWQAALRRAAPDLVVRRNYPYRGVSDGFTTFLRKQYSAARYAGVELEVNQRWPRAGGAGWRRLKQVLAETLAESV